MNAVPAFRPKCCCTYRWLARASAGMLLVIWLAMLALEGRPASGLLPGLGGQLAILAVVFAGYAVSLRHEAAGAVISLIGVAAFFVVTYFDLHAATGAAFAWFALPPVLYLVSARLARRERAAAAPTPPVESA